MKRSYWMTTAAAVLMLAASAPPARTAPAEGSPLAQVPATAPVVIHLNGLEEVRDHVVAFLKNAVPDRADMVEKQSEEFMKNGVAGRKLRGLAKDGPIFVVLTELPKPGTAGGPDNPPKMAIIAAVTDYAEFRDNVLSDKEKKGLKAGDGYESTAADTKGDIYFVNRKEYVVVTPSKDVAAALAKAPAEGLEGKLGKRQAERFLKSDLGVYVDMAAVNKEYADQIKAAHKAVDEQLNKVGDTVGKAQKAQFDLVKKFIGPIFQAIEDTQTALYTLDIGAEGVALRKETDLRSGSPTADLFKGFKSSSFKDMAKLPAGQVFYSGMAMDPAMLKFAGSILTGLSTDPDSKGAKALAEGLEGWAKAGPTESVGSVSYPIHGVSVVQCADPEKAVAAQVQMLEAMGTEGIFQNVAFKEKPVIKEKAEKYKDIEFTSVHMVWDLDKALSPAATGGKELPEKMRKQMAEGMKKLMGDSLNTWIGVDGKAVVSVMGKDWDEAQKLLDQYYKGEGTAGDDKVFAAARKELPREATFLMMIDLVQYVGVVMDFAKPIIESTGTTLPAKFPSAVKDKPGYVGIAMRLGGEHPSADLVISAEAVKQVYKGYVVPFLPSKGD